MIAIQAKSQRQIAREAQVSDASVNLFLNRKRKDLSLKTASNVVETLPYAGPYADYIIPADQTSQIIAQMIQEIDALYAIGNFDTDEESLDLIEKRIDQGHLQYKRLMPTTRESAQVRSHLKNLSQVRGDVQVRTTSANIEEKLYISDTQVMQQMAAGGYLRFEGAYVCDGFIDYFNQLFYNEGAKPFDLSQL